MTRFWGHLATGSASIGLVVALSSACAHDDATIFVRQISAPPQSQTGGQCTYTCDFSQGAIPQGTLDIGLLSTYTGEVMVGNQLVAKQVSIQNRAETSRVELNGAVVRVTDAGGRELSSFTSLGSGFADPSTGTTPGCGLIAVTLLDGATAESLRAQIGRGQTRQVVANFKIFGKSLGGQDVETNEYAYPINVCNGCLVTFPPDSVDPALAAATHKPNCSATTATTTATATPCVAGQDQFVDCRACQGNPVCDPSTAP
jgi:hypothetical protein